MANRVKMACKYCRYGMMVVLARYRIPVPGTYFPNNTWSRCTLFRTIYYRAVLVPNRYWLLSSFSIISQNAPFMESGARNPSQIIFIHTEQNRPLIHTVEIATEEAPNSPSDREGFHCPTDNCQSFSITHLVVAAY